MAGKSAPFSIRLSSFVEALVNEQARRSRRSKSAVVEALAEEAAKVRIFPGIAFRGNDWQRRAWVIGTGLDVWELVAASRDFESPDKMAQETDLTHDQISLALAYYRRFPEEIDEAISLGDRSIEQLTDQFPTIPALQE